MSAIYRRHEIDEESSTDFECKLCDGTKNIKWRCIECKIKICDKCRIIHSNARASINHTIISFSDMDCYFLDTQIKRRIKELPCRRHPHQTCTLYCKTCKSLICMSCVPVNHTDHELTGIDQYMDLNLRNSGQEVSLYLPPKFLARSPSHDESYCIISADFQVISTVITNMPVINQLKVVSVDSAWIGCVDNNEVQMIKLPLKSKKPVLQLFYKKIKKYIECTTVDIIEGFEVLDMELTDNDILFVSYLDHNLKRAFTDAYGQKQICNIHDFSPLDPICIHIEKDRNLMWIGLKERGKADLLPMSIRKVIAISETWKIEKTFEFTTKGKRLFTLPFRISDVDDMLCVLDLTSNKSGRVVSINPLGHFMWEYKDVQDTSTCVKPFFPAAIATIEKNKIIVIDAANSSLHVLSSAGNIIAFHSLTQLEVERPYSLDVDVSGQLWIGCKCDRMSEKKRAKLHVVKMSLII